MLGKNIQVLGHFNPPLFVPRWFADVGLLPEAEATAAGEFIHEEVAQFNTDWVTVSVTKDRMAVSTTRLSHIEPLRDLVVGTLDLLSHTPTSVFGINHDFLLDFEDRESFDEFGWTLVPPTNWPELNRPGMALTMLQGVRQDEREGYVRVKVEPFLDGQLRVVVGVNDHYQVEAAHASTATPKIVQIIAERWFDSIEEADRICESLAGAKES